MKAEIGPGTNIDPTKFRAEYEKVIADLVPINRRLLDKRNELQAQIDEWHERHRGEPDDMEAYHPPPTPFD